MTHGVQIEPHLQPLTGEELPVGTNLHDEVRLDIAARGFWQNSGMAFFDVRIFDLFANTHLKTTLDHNFQLKENLKKKAYNDRVIVVEHGSFIPIVLSSMRGFGRETGRFVSE